MPTAARLPLALAQARIEFDTLLRDRVRAMLAPTSTAADGAPVDVPDEVSDEAALLDASARAFVEAVDRDNDRRQQVAGKAEPVLAYDDAVVITGSAGPLVISVDDYDRERVYHEARAGKVDSVTTGPELLAYLRTGEPQAARGLGLR